MKGLAFSIYVIVEPSVVANGPIPKSDLTTTFTTTDGSTITYIEKASDFVEEINAISDTNFGYPFAQGNILPDNITAGDIISVTVTVEQTETKDTASIVFNVSAKKGKFFERREGKNVCKTEKRAYIILFIAVCKGKMEFSRPEFMRNPRRKIWTNQEMKESPLWLESD